MEQPGPEPRPEQPDRADGPGRPPGLPWRDARDRPNQEDLDRQLSRRDHPAYTGARDQGHPVVIGYDGSPSSRNALAYAAGLARRLARPLLVVYVVPFGVYCEPMTGQVICAARDRSELDQWLLAELDQVCDREGLDVSVMARRRAGPSPAPCGRLDPQLARAARPLPGHCCALTRLAPGNRQTGAIAF